MNSAPLLEQFDRISEAPEAVPRLRRFILDLAVRGKLVGQDPNDEPAAQLLKRIQAEKARLVKSGAARKAKPVEPILDEDLPFAIPANWAWSQLAEVGFVNPRNNAADDLPASFVPMPLISAEYGVASRHEVRPWADIKSGFTHFAEGDVALAKITPCFENGKSAAFRGLTGGIGAGTTELHVVRPVLASADYVLLFLKSSHFIESGVPCMTGTAGQKRVPTSYFAHAPFPLPPLAEQCRIVAKTDELMALCDRLDTAQLERERKRDQLVASSLDRLDQPVDSDALREGARFHFTHLARLTTRSNQVASLRQSILSLAVAGRLVAQDPHDESGPELLRRILVEKKSQAAAGALKRDKEIWDGLPHEPPHVLPSNWVWTRMQDLFEISRGGSPRPAGDPRYFGGPIPWITVREITKDQEKILTTTEAGLTEEGSLRSRFVNPGDLLLTNSGATLGVPKVCGIRACMNDGVAVLRAFHSIPLNDFAYMYLQSQTKAFRRVNQGMGQPNLNTGIIAGWFFPLPPLGEQRRIVAKVDELMALCDRLEEQLVVAQAESRRLLDATLHEALAVGA
jgi:type I restriction enzyme, S subunit